jgi:predicted RNase H-like nuclease (RuvC/YqgF family)
MVKDEARQERLNQVYRHLFAHFGITSQIVFAKTLHVQRSALSAAMNGNKAYLTDNLFTKICAAFPNVFNYNYLVKGEGDLLTVEEDVKSTRIEKQQTDIPDYVQRLCDEAARMATRNEMLERQFENLIAELRESREKNDAFLIKLENSKEDNDAMMAELRISKKQNESLIAELRETKKNNGMLSTKLENSIESIEGMKAQMSMMLSNFNVIKEQNQLGQLRVNDNGEPVIAIQVPNVVTQGKKSKTGKVPTGYIRGDVKVITDLMIKQARAAFPQKKK